MIAKRTVFFKTTFTLVMATLFLAIPFNNCGQKQQSDALAFGSLEDFQSEFQKVAADHYNLTDCDEADAYGCLQKSFAPNHEDGQVQIDFACLEVASGVKICPKGEKYTFNSSSQIETCESCSEDEVNRRYRLDEFVCFHRGIKLDGVFPIRADGSSFPETLQATYQSCRKVLGSE